MKVRAVVAGVVALGLVGGGVAWAVQQQPRPISYTTATVVRGDVTQSFTASGTVQRTGRNDVAFDGAGLVTALSVKLGDKVSAGAKLAAIDPAPLQLSLLQAQAQLAQARATLDADQTAKDNGGTVAAAPGTATAAPAGGAATAPAATGGGGSGAAATPAYVTALQASMKRLAATVAAQQAACAPVYAVVGQLQQLQAQLPTALPTTLPTALPTGHPGHSASPSAAPSSPQPSSPEPSNPAPTSPTASATPSAEATQASPTVEPSPASASPQPAATPASSAVPSSPAPVAKLTGTVQPTVTLPAALASLSPEQVKKLAGSLQACTTAMVALAGAEQEAGQAIVAASSGLQAATAAAQQQLAAAQAQLVTAAQAAARQAAAQAMAEAQAQLAAQAQRALGSRVTDATLAADRARVLQAEQAVGRAQRSLDAATLTAPVGGVVGAIDLVPGESSAGRTVTIVAPGAAAIDVQVPLSLRPLVSAGMPAVVGAVGADPILRGAVESVSVLATSAAARPTYTARVVVDDAGLTLADGSKAEATLTLATASEVVTVPLSAVTTTSDTTGTVEVVSDPRAEASQVVQVTTGAHGGGRVEITSGLQPGQLVVLADRRLPVPGGLQQYQPAQSATPRPTKQ